MTHPVDAHVGQRIRLRRRIANKTQQELAKAVGIKFQQIQKYETGANRVSASRLFDIANVLDTPVSYFFDEIEEAAETGSSDQSQNKNPAPQDRTLEVAHFTGRESVEFLRCYYALDEEPRRRIYELTRSISAAA